MAFSTLGKQIRRPGECASQGYLSESVRKTKVHGWRGAGQDFTEVGLWGSPIAASPSPIEKAGTQMVCQHCPGMSWNGLLFPHPDQSYRSWAALKGVTLVQAALCSLANPEEAASSPPSSKWESGNGADQGINKAEGDQWSPSFLKGGDWHERLLKAGLDRIQRSQGLDVQPLWPTT